MGQKFQCAQKIPSPPKPLTHNLLHIIHFLIGNFSHKTLYINDLHTTTSLMKNTPTLKTPHPNLELTYNIIMNNIAFIKSYIKGSYLGEVKANTIPHDMTLVEYIRYVGKETWAELITSAMYEEGILS